VSALADPPGLWYNIDKVLGKEASMSKNLDNESGARSVVAP